MHNSTSLFTIITTTYNRKKYLKQCIESLNNQTYRNYEHIIVDGYSTDGTYELVKKLTKKSQNKPIILQREPKGVYDAINYALEYATGDYIHILNSDDYFYNNDVLMNIERIIVQNNYPNYIQGRRYQIINNWVFKNLEKVGHQQAFIKREMHIKYGKYDTRYKYVSDTKFLLNLNDNEGCVRTEMKTVIQRNHKNSLTMSGINSYHKWMPEIIKLYIERLLQK